MKKFALRCFGLSAAEQQIWHQAGFEPLLEGVIDVVLLGSEPSRAAGLCQPAWKLLDQLRPKVFMIHVDTVGDQWMGGQNIYTVREYGISPNLWVVGTKLEAPLPDDMGALLVEQEMAALAESLYYYLLRDVFRETADWCGHMSSVVGRM